MKTYKLYPLYGTDVEQPEWHIWTNFTSSDDLFAYTSRADYAVQNSNSPGICYGYEFVNNNGAYSLKIYMND